ncbi:unnamed protein product [Heligmosomoides polygyrus]|uniref:Uncharacterized protein n=1 Tax=Heligmosomoides polygyrus TaxID=6339 RepID=A0A183G311_HELPZ|nr:unnamed protein product [Heligmosomoides polygyrus]
MLKTQLNCEAYSTDLRDWGLHLSRRFKALKVWFIMRLCGVEGLRRHVNKICDMASYFESLIDQHPNMQIFTSRNFGLFTFQYNEPNFTKEERNRHTLRLLCFFNESHKLFLTHVRVADNDVIRVSLSYERTTKQTIDSAFGIMKTMVEEYKKRKDDATLLKAPIKKTSSAEHIFTSDADFLLTGTAAAVATATTDGKYPDTVPVGPVAAAPSAQSTISQSMKGVDEKESKSMESEKASKSTSTQAAPGRHAGAGSSRAEARSRTPTSRPPSVSTRSAPSGSTAKPKTDQQTKPPAQK